MYLLNCGFLQEEDEEDVVQEEEIGSEEEEVSSDDDDLPQKAAEFKWFDDLYVFDTG